MCILENGEIEIMDLAIIAAKQVLEMFLMILAGFICFKTGVIKEEGKKALSDLLLYLVVPAMIVNSYLVEHDSSMTGNLVRMLIYSILMVGTGLVITYAVLFSKKNKDRDFHLFRHFSVRREYFMQAYMLLYTIFCCGRLDIRLSRKK